MASPSLSVIITNYNYDRYLNIAIDSLLGQPVPIEVIVVDDASSDQSQQKLAEYGPEIKRILKDKNLGQGDSFNQGFKASTGDIVLFLDSDDFMLSGAAQTILDMFDPKSALNVYRMVYADTEGNTYGLFPPLEADITRGAASRKLLEHGAIKTTVTSGMVYPRWVLDQILPAPIEDFHEGGDGFLASSAPLYGPIKVHDLPITAYRQHRIQHSKFLGDYSKRARWCISHNAARYKVIRKHAAKLGMQANEDLAACDLDNLRQRLISLTFEPDLHPINDDRADLLIRQIIALQRNYDEGFVGAARLVWWYSIQIVNNDARKTLLSWQVDPFSRPVWLGKLGRFIRKKLKMAI